MNNEHDMALQRLFDHLPEPEPDEAFTEYVAMRIARMRRHQRIRMMLLVAVLAALTVLLGPRLMSLTGYLGLVSNAITHTLLAAMFSPIGWIIIAAAGMSVFLQTRPRWI